MMYNKTNAAKEANHTLLIC